MDVPMSEERAWLFRKTAEAGKDVLEAWTRAIQDYEPSGDFAPENEHLEKYMDVAWALLVPMGKLRLALASIEAQVHHERVIRAFAAMGRAATAVPVKQQQEMGAEREE